MRLGFAGIIAVAFLALEMVGMYLIAGKIGWPSTLLWLIASFFGGSWVIRRAGAGFLPALSASINRGHAPFAILWATGRRFMAGALLILPGAISDVIALGLLLWPGPRLPPARPRDDGVIEGEFRREEDIVERIPPTREPG
jgi:UPF0716 protein FxsA